MTHLAIGTSGFAGSMLKKERRCNIHQTIQENRVGMVVNFIHGNVSWVSFLRMRLFGASASCTGDHRVYSMSVGGSRVSSVRTTAKTSAILRSMLSSVRHNELMVSGCIVSAISIVRIVATLATTSATTAVAATATTLTALRAKTTLALTCVATPATLIIRSRSTYNIFAYFPHGDSHS